MAKPGKKKKQTKAAAARPVDQTKVGAALAALPSDSAAVGALHDGELGALVDQLVAAEAAESLGALAQLQLKGGRGKVVKRGCYLLQQRGLDVDAPQPKGLDLRPSDVPADLALMMAPPHTDAGRRFTFPIDVDATQLSIIELYFAMPEGMYRVVAASSTPRRYASWAAEMMSNPSERIPELPERIRIDQAMLDRKLWEIGQHMKSGRRGAEVDLPLAKRLGNRKMMPDHPALAMDLSGAHTLTMEELGARPHLLQPFHHHAPEAVLRDEWGEFGGSELIQGGEQSSMERSVSEWAGQWGHVWIRELLLDLTYYYAKLGDPDVALTFRELAAVEDAAEREAGINAFLYDWAMWFFRNENRVRMD